MYIVVLRCQTRWKVYRKSRLRLRSRFTKSQSMISVTMFRCYLMKMSRGSAIYVICITVASYITRSALFWFSVTSRSLRPYSASCVFSSDLFKAPPLCPSSRNEAAQHRQFRRCYMRACIYIRTVHGAIREISCRVRRRPRVKTWREYTCMRLSIAPQSLLSAGAYLFTARHDVFRIDVRIYVTWESHEVLFSSLECSL